jgi:hypothetical protein
MSVLLSDFKNNVKDVVRPNRFRVEFYLSSSVFASLEDVDSSSVADAQQVSSDIYKLQFMVKASSLPGRSISPIEYKRHGATIKYVGDPTYEDIDVTFINDDEMTARRLIDGWMEQIAGFEGNKRLSSEFIIKDSYMIIYQLGRDGNPVRGYELLGVWPKVCQATDLNMESTDQISEFVTTFAYSYWRIV